MKLRSALASDAEAMGHVRVLAWQAAYGAFMPKSFLDALDPLANIDSWRKWLAQPSGHSSIGVAEADGSVVGFFTAGLPRYTTGENCFELWALNVHPAYWRRGIGQALTMRAAEVAKSQDFERMELWCISGNSAARSAYESYGFSLAGQERCSSALTGQALHEILYAKVL